MEKTFRINVRLDEPTYRHLDVVRATRGEKWQSLIERLLAEWADGPAPAPTPSAPAEIDPMVLAISELIAKPENLQKLKAILLTFASR